MNGFLIWLWGQLQHNQFLAAALVAAPVTVLTYAVRAVPMRIWRSLKNQFTLSVTFNSDAPDYLAAQEFVADHIASARFTRSFVYSAERKWDSTACEDATVFRGLTPGYGPHFGWWRGRPVLITRDQQPNTASEKFKEQLKITFVSRRRSLVEAFAAAIHEHGSRQLDRNHIGLFINAGSWWRAASRLPKRSLETVFTPADTADQLLDHVRKFEQQQGWYRARGLPWHTGIMLTGKPGTGKTSLVHALASELGRSLYYLNLGSIESDQQLAELVAGSRDWTRALLVIEDADAGGLNVQREPPVSDAPGGASPAPRQPVTLSALLNVLDGLLTPDGLVVIASSNYPDKLDAALLRPGRFDLQLELGDLDWSSFVAMAQLFDHPLAIDDPRAERYIPQPGATLRAKLIEGGVEAALRPAVRVVAA